MNTLYIYREHPVFKVGENGSLGGNSIFRLTSQILNGIVANSVRIPVRGRSFGGVYHNPVKNLRSYAYFQCWAENAKAGLRSAPISPSSSKSYIQGPKLGVRAPGHYMNHW